MSRMVDGWRGEDGWDGVDSLWISANGSDSRVRESE